MSWPVSDGLLNRKTYNQTHWVAMIASHLNISSRGSFCMWCSLETKILSETSDWGVKAILSGSVRLKFSIDSPPSLLLALLVGLSMDLFRFIWPEIWHLPDLLRVIGERRVVGVKDIKVGSWSGWTVCPHWTDWNISAGKSQLTVTEISTVLIS